MREGGSRSGGASGEVRRRGFDARASRCAPRGARFRRAASYPLINRFFCRPRKRDEMQAVHRRRVAVRPRSGAPRRKARRRRRQRRARAGCRSRRTRTSSLRSNRAARDRERARESSSSSARLETSRTAFFALLLLRTTDARGTNQMSAGGPVSLRPGGAGVSLRPGGDAAGAASPFSSFAMGSKPQVRARRSTSPSPGAPQRPPRPRSNFDLARRRQTPSVTIIYLTAPPPRPPPPRPSSALAGPERGQCEAPQQRGRRQVHEGVHDAVQGGARRDAAAPAGHPSRGRTAAP